MRRVSDATIRVFQQVAGGLFAKGFIRTELNTMTDSRALEKGFWASCSLDHLRSITEEKATTRLVTCLCMKAYLQAALALNGSTCTVTAVWSPGQEQINTYHIDLQILLSPFTWTVFGQTKLLPNTVFVSRASTFQWHIRLWHGALVTA